MDPQHKDDGSPEHPYSENYKQAGQITGEETQFPHSQNVNHPQGYEQPHNNHPQQPEDNYRGNLYQEPASGSVPISNTSLKAPYHQPHMSNNHAPMPMPGTAQKPGATAVYTPGNLILQWLTYAFWGWTIIAMSVLTADVIYSFLKDNNSGSFTAYAVAAVLVLLPISAVTDFLYSKQEPVKKTGPASIILIIHAVIFALFGIGAVITAVFSLVSMATSSGENTSSIVALFSAIIIAFFYSLVFIRTMDFAKLYKIKKHFTKIMVLLVGIIIVMAIIGPFAQERRTRNDRLLSENLSSVEGAVNAYTKENKALPENLNQLSLKGDAKILVDKNLIKYTPNTLPSSTIQPDTSTTSLYGITNSKSTAPTYFYTMCVTYIKDAPYSSYDYYDGSSYSGKQTYTENPSFYDYSAGENCYKIKTTAYNL